MDDKEKMMKQLQMAMMLGSVFMDDRVELTPETVFVIGEEEFKHELKDLKKVGEGDVIALGTKKEDSAPYEIIKAEKNRITLRKVQFFKAELVLKGAATTTDYCIMANDLSDAKRILREFCQKPNSPYARMLSIKESGFFNPMIQ
jgi:hypothetical protein